jgi:hypothetical protein
MEKTERAQTILDAMGKIEKWCNNSLQNKSFDVFVLQKISGVHSWYGFVYCATHSKLFMVKGDHSRWGAQDFSYKTGMTVDRFNYYTFDCDGGSNHDYARLKKDGNLCWDEEIAYFIKNWATIKERIMDVAKEEDIFCNFEA